MRGDVLGYYGCGELCDDLLLHLIKKTFDSLGEIEWHPKDGGGLDLLILGGGSLLGLPNAFLKEYLERSSCVFCIFGAGFRGINPNDSGLDDLRFLWERADLIAVRGRVSVERLDGLGFDVSKISALGDPIFLMDGKSAGEECVGGVTRPYNVDLGWMKQIFEFLRREIGQEVRLFSFCDGQGDLIGEELSYRTQSFIDESYSKDAVLRGDHSFQSIMESSCAAVYRSSFWFGNRLHPFCVALINSIPTIGVEIEFRKVEDVCSTLDYSYWIRANAPLEEFKEMYYKLTSNWKKVNEGVQKRIAGIKEDLRALARRALDIAQAARGEA